MTGSRRQARGAPVESPSGPTAETIRVALDRVLSSPDFEATERTRRFLAFLVEETLAGRKETLKGYTIARAVFGRGADFDAALDPVVRIQGGRLRRALERYYFQGGRTDPLRIEVPKGSYAPVFHLQAPGSADRGPRGKRPAGPGLDAPSGAAIAVSPFTYPAGDDDQAYFANGLTEELTIELNRYAGILAVSCQGATSSPLNGETGLRDLASQLHARFLLTGSLRRDAGTVRVSAHLVDGTTGAQIWGESYSRPLEALGLIATQEEMAARIVAVTADEMGIVPQRLAREARSKRPAELSTYEALLRYHQYMLVMSRDEYVASFAALQAAVAREPEYGPAWSALANLHAHAYLFDVPGIAEPLETAFEQARRGAALDPASQLSRTIMAFVFLLKAEKGLFMEEAETALALNPNSPYYAGTIGYLFAIAGEFDRGQALLEYSISLNPCHPKWFHHACFVCHMARGAYEEAYREACRVGFQIGFWDPVLRACALGKLGRIPEARAAADEVRALRPDFESRARELMNRTVRIERVVNDGLEGLRAAGMRV